MHTQAAAQSSLLNAFCRALIAVAAVPTVAVAAIATVPCVYQLISSTFGLLWGLCAASTHVMFEYNLDYYIWVILREMARTDCSPRALHPDCSANRSVTSIVVKRLQ